MTQLTLSQVGLSCPAGLPPSLAGLEALNTLDLAFNSLNSTTDRVAQVCQLNGVVLVCGARARCAALLEL